MFQENCLEGLFVTNCLENSLACFPYFFLFFFFSFVVGEYSSFFQEKYYTTSLLQQTSLTTMSLPCHLYQILHEGKLWILSSGLFWQFLVNLNSDNLKHNHSSLLQAQSYLVFLTSGRKIYPMRKAVAQSCCRAGRVRRHLLRLRAGKTWRLETSRKGGRGYAEVLPVPAL